MKRIVFIPLSAGAMLLLFLLTGGFLFYQFDPDMKERRDRDAKLQDLLATHAHYEQVSNTLRMPFLDYSVDSTNRSGFESWLSRERTNNYGPVRAAAAKYPKVYYHTTMYTMTWLFFDAEERLQDYYLCSQ